jgi:N-acyl-D-amino-acid deacylase
VLGKYSREEGVIPLEEAIRRLTLLAATNLRLTRRGWPAPGYYADVVVFQPEAIRDHATFEKPRQYATGLLHVFVNGVQVLANGEQRARSRGGSCGARDGKVGTEPARRLVHTLLGFVGLDARVC